MALEVEHKFLLANDAWRQTVEHSVYYKQGYLSSSPLSSVRVRISDTQAWLNIKSATIGNHRQEFEYEIPLADADDILETLCHKPLVENGVISFTTISICGRSMKFMGENAGLIVAEIELSQIGESFAKPSWIGEEVTQDLRYYNNNLVDILIKIGINNKKLHHALKYGP